MAFLEISKKEHMNESPEIEPAFNYRALKLRWSNAFVILQRSKTLERSKRLNGYKTNSKSFKKAFEEHLKDITHA